MFTPPKPSSRLRISSTREWLTSRSKSSGKGQFTRKIFQRLAQLSLAVFMNEGLTCLRLGSLHLESAARIAHFSRSTIQFRQLCGILVSLPASFLQVVRKSCNLFLFTSAITFNRTRGQFQIRDREFQLVTAAAHLCEIHSVSINSRCKVGEFAFSSSYFGSSSATTFGSSSRSRSLLRERFAFCLQLASQVGQQGGGFNHVVSGGFPCLLSSFSLYQSLDSAVPDF